MSQDPPMGRVAISVLGYTVCSSMLLIINKATVMLIPMASFVSVLQFMACVLLCWAFKVAKTFDIDDFETEKVKMYMVYVGMFVLTIYCNMAALRHSNIETVICFRSCVPIVVSVLDWAFMGRELPGIRSSLSLIGIVMGAVGYVSTDKQFEMQGLAAYFWVLLYFAIISVEMTYGKFLVSGVKLKSMWSAVLYTNALSIVPMSLWGLCMGEAAKLDDAVWSTRSGGLLAISCLLGVGISYTGWDCRSLVSATTYTVIGVLNKFLTLTVNTVIWDKHASAIGTAWLSLCLICGALYQQAPLRKIFPNSPEVFPSRGSEDEESVPLVDLPVTQPARKI